MHTSQGEGFDGGHAEVCEKAREAYRGGDSRAERSDVGVLPEADGRALRAEGRGTARGEEAGGGGTHEGHGGAGLSNGGGVSHAVPRLGH